jgi:hypothetical protein
MSVVVHQRTDNGSGVGPAAGVDAVVLYAGVVGDGAAATVAAVIGVGVGGVVLA